LEHLSPEERLLRLIRRPKKVPSPEPSGSQPVSQSTAVTAPPLQPVVPGSSRKWAFSFPTQWFAGQKDFSFLRKVNLALTVSVAVIFLFLGWSLRTSKAVPVSSELGLSGRVKKSDTSAEAEAVKPYSYYGETIEKRDIFRPSFSGNTKGTANAVVSAKEMAKDLNLVGIVAGKNPHAIIEDKKDGKTLLVNKGDTVGDLRVEEIQEDRVILSYQGEQMDLVL